MFQQGMQGSRSQTNKAMENAAAGLAGLWVLLVQNDGEISTQDADGRVPVMARAGDHQTYLLVFKNVAKARQFVAASEIEGAEPRIVGRALVFGSGERESVERARRGAAAPSFRRRAVLR